MRNGLLASLLLLLAAAPLAAQPPAATPCPPPEAPTGPPPWAPPRTDLEDRPDVAPPGWQWYGNFDYLYWWTQKDRPLTVLTDGHPGNAALAAGTDFDPAQHHGLRGTLGHWLDNHQMLGVEASGLWLSSREPGWRGASGGFGVHTEAAQHAWAAGLDLRWLLLRGDYFHLDFIGGFRHLSLDEALSIDERGQASGAITNDRCGTRNRFYGGELGLEAELHNGKWSVDVYGKVALGGNDEAVQVNGTTLAGGALAPGGLVTSPLVGGRYDRGEFATVSEFGMHLNYEVTNTIRASVGYSFLYVSDVVRPAEQFDGLRQSPRAGQFPFQTSDFWGQGISVGVEFRF
jgi:hypothetical protein